MQIQQARGERMGFGDGEHSETLQDQQNPNSNWVRADSRPPFPHRLICLLPGVVM